MICWTCFFDLEAILNLVQYQFGQHVSRLGYSIRNIRRRFYVNHSERQGRTFAWRLVAVDHQFRGHLGMCQFDQKIVDDTLFLVNEHGCPMNMPSITLKFISSTPNLISMPFVHNYKDRDTHRWMHFTSINIFNIKNFRDCRTYTHTEKDR